MTEPGLSVPLAIESLILSLRGHRVLLDAELAALYGVETKALNRAVKRNAERFPADFMFQLTEEEVATLRYQSGTSKPGSDDVAGSQFVSSGGRGGRRYRPYAFTEQGVAMLSGVLHSTRAVQVNIEIMRTFVRLRQMLKANAELAGQLAALERKYDRQFKAVFDAIRELMDPPKQSGKRIGFGARDGE